MPLVKYLPTPHIGQMCVVDEGILRELYDRTEETSETELVTTGIIVGKLEGHDGPVYSVFLTNGMFWHFGEDEIEINEESSIEQSVGYLEMVEIDATNAEVAEKAKQNLRSELLKRHADNQHLRASA